MSSRAPTDLTLLAAVRTGDATALAALLDRHWADLARFGAHLLGSVDAGEDAAQEAFVRLWARRDGWRGAGSVRGLLYRLVRNSAVDARRRGATRRRADERSAAAPAPSPSPAGDLATAELERAVAQAIARLPARRRDVFVLVRLHGLSHRETADALGLSPQTVANHLGLALSDLRRMLRPHLPGTD